MCFRINLLNCQQIQALEYAAVAIQEGGKYNDTMTCEFSLKEDKLTNALRKTIQCIRNHRSKK